MNFISNRFELEFISPQPLVERESYYILFTILTCEHRICIRICLRHWLLCHLGLYQPEFEKARTRGFGARTLTARQPSTLGAVRERANARH